MPPTRRTTTVEFVRGSVRGTRRRALATLPSLFTLANMFCGFFAILVSIRGEYGLAAVLIGLSIVFDITDGAVARLVGAVTPFGLQFDSLADLVSFGLAPALLAFTLFSQGRDEWDPLGWVACFVWVACAAIRLARFNTTVDPTADKRYFIGLPSPGAAGVVLASVFAFGDQMQGRDRLWVLLVVVVPALLMVSNIRFRSFRSLVSPKSGRPYAIIALAVRPGRRLRARAHCHRHRAGLRLPAGAAAAADRLAAGPAAAGAAQGGPLMTVRPIRPDDVPAVVALVRELADYEKALHEVRLTEEQLTGVLFGDSPALFGHVAETDGEVVGIALWFLNFSTWRGTHGIYLEDLYVSPGHRGVGARQGAAAHAGGGLRRARLLAAGVVGAGLEHPVDRVLQGRRRRPHGRVDRLPPHRRRPDRLRRRPERPHDHRARADPSAG